MQKTSSTTTAGVDIPDTTCRSSPIPFTLPQDAEPGGNKDGMTAVAAPPPMLDHHHLSEDIQMQHHSKGSSSSSSKKHSTKMTLTKQKTDGETIVVNNFYF